jgi:hypothetical protein
VDAFDNLRKNSTKAALDTAQAELSLFDFGTARLSFYSSAFDTFSENVANLLQDALESSGGQIALQSGYLLTNVGQIAHDGGYGELFTTSVNLVAQTAFPLSAWSQGLAEAIGNVVPASNQAATLTGVSLSSNGNSFTTIADASGAYDLVIPLNASSYNYSSATLGIVDPLTQNAIGSRVIDLTSGLELCTLAQQALAANTDLSECDCPYANAECDSAAVAACYASGEAAIASLSLTVQQLCRVPLQ